VKTLTNQDTLDSRDIIARIEELETETEDWKAEDTEGNPLGDTYEDMRTELEELRQVIEEISGYAGDSPEQGIFLIRDSYFVEYAQEFAEDIGAIPHNTAWPCTCIDWEQAAHELRMDYTSIEIGEITYWYR